MSEPTDTLTDVAAREVVLRVDFELLDDDRLVWVSHRFLRGKRAPEPGQLVYLLDARGRGCVGTVDHVHGWYVGVRPDWTTWTGGPLPSAVADVRRSAQRR